MNTAFDQNHIWHPYAPLPAHHAALPVVGAKGVEIELADGRKLIDGMASWWAAIHGYNHPILNQALETQLGKFAHVMFGGLTHAPAIELAERLIDLTPATLDRVFFADSGSVAVEVALKIALQYQAGAGRPERQKLLTVKRGYHGDTLGAMSVCDPDNGMHRLFSGALPQQIFAPEPQPAHHPDCGTDIQALAALMEQHQHEIAALILEPIVQGAGGMRIYRPEYLSAAAELCQQYGILLILDEIATGFGRTGSLFACQQANVEPDILCLGKALTGGYLSLAATLTTEKVAHTVSNGEAGALMHGPTFMANPLACSAALASIDLLLSQDWQTRIQAIETQLEHELEPARQLPQVRDVRCKGAIGIIELKQPAPVADIQRHTVERGVWIRPFSNLVYIMPPYIIRPDQLSRVTQAMISAIAET